MKIQRTLAVLITAIAVSAAQQCAANIVGFFNKSFATGPNFFANPFDHTNNNLSSLVMTAPEGASVSLWNSVTHVYNSVAVYTGGAWVGDTLLNPGTGAVLFAPNPFVNTFVGTVLDANGGIYNGSTVNPPSPFAGPDGLYLWADKFPAAAGTVAGYELWQLVVGRVPNDGEKFYRFNGIGFDATTFSFGTWDNGAPFLNIGESGFFDIGGTGLLPIAPEPGSLALLALGVGGWLMARRFRPAFVRLRR